ncbi:MAG: hypothetical protein D6717_01060 [Gammaproteobacteria bacterium]|nr:MAG: hypothetical protein D6717_01060 [Gammaproteobacteria bacterium]
MDTTQGNHHSAGDESGLPTIQRVISVLWPSFIVAGIATIITFTVFDPLQIAACMGEPGVTRLGAYSTGFFLFWVFAAASSGLTCYFRKPTDTIDG